jgi:transposase-like protein
VALEAVRGEKTILELTSQYGIHSTMIHNWKRQLLEGASSLFENSSKGSRGSENHQAQMGVALLRQRNITEKQAL